MEKSKRIKTAIASLLVVILLFTLIPLTALAEERNLPLYAFGGTELLADSNTQYIAEIEQDPNSKMITASFKIRNGSPNSTLIIAGVGIQLTFDNTVAPYNPASNSKYEGGPTENIIGYIAAPVVGFDTIGARIMQNSPSGRYVGAKVSTKDSATISVNAGASVTVAKLFFMPTNNSTVLNLDMFKFEYTAYLPLMLTLSTWIANGSRYLVSNSVFPTDSYVYAVVPSAFKMHFVQPKPAVSANTSSMTITGYDASTMEWATGSGGPYSKGTPTISGNSNISVRYSESSYSGTDGEYVNYKKYMASEAVAVSFDGSPGTPTSPTTIEVTFNPNGGTIRAGDLTSRYVTVGGQYGTFPTVTRSGYDFDGWYTAATGGSRVESTTLVGTNGNHTLYAHWKTPGSGGDNGDGNKNDDNNKDGNNNGGNDGNNNGGYSGGDNTTYYPPTGAPLAGFTDQHIPYISGYPDGTMRPENAVTRAEVAMIFFRLLTIQGKDIQRASIFKDVKDGEWYSQAINFLASIEILAGYPDGTFRPNQTITRAEFAAVASRFDDLSQASDSAFPDIAGHWAASYINSAYAKGWISGYPEGTFRPQQNIKRCEVVKIVNTMLNRKVRVEDIPPGIKVFNDIGSHWAYTEIVEASNDHDYMRRSDNYEMWSLK
ncbi:MAG: S-layer homology domain-containing protein [Oscillospiraceae bacterium]|nr:S-layer homology domain-containing protein [Oscillospiraceae bacterium]